MWKKRCGRYPVLSAALAGCSCSLPAQTVSRPNIIYILTDDQGYTDLGIMGLDPNVQTPNLDSLASNGVLFTEGYCTAPQCRPSRAGVMTARYQNRFGYVDNNDGGMPLLDPSGQPVVTIAERIRDQGYRTGQVGKWHLSPIQGEPDYENAIQYDPDHRGFVDQFEGTRRAYTATYDLDGNEHPRARLIFPPDSHRVDIQTAAACAFIQRAHDRSEPFFLYLSYYAPHTPRLTDTNYYANFPIVDYPQYNADENDIRRQGLAIIQAVDTGVGNIMQKLRDLDIEDNTIILFASDNGAPLGLRPNLPRNLETWNGSENMPLRGTKGGTWEGGIRVPMLMYWKNRLPGGRIYQEPVTTLDLSATAVALAGGSLPAEGYDGVNLMPYLTDEESGAPHENLFWSYGIPAWGYTVTVRCGNWKLRQFSNKNFLFNLETDREEATNLADAFPMKTTELIDLSQSYLDSLPPSGVSELRTAEEATLDAVYQDPIVVMKPPLRTWLGLASDPVFVHVENWDPSTAWAHGDVLRFDGRRSGTLDLSYSGGQNTRVLLDFTADQTGTVGIRLTGETDNNRNFRLGNVDDDAAITIAVGAGKVTLDGQDADSRMHALFGPATDPGSAQNIVINNAGTLEFGEFSRLYRGNFSRNYNLQLQGGGQTAILGQVNAFGVGGGIRVQQDSVLTLSGEWSANTRLMIDQGRADFTSVAAIAGDEYLWGSIRMGNNVAAGHGTLRYTGTGDVQIDRQVQIGNGTAGDNQTGSATIENASATGKLVFGNTAFNEAMAGTQAARTLTLGGNNTLANEISGVIADNDTGAGGTIGVIKEDDGSWILSGGNTYTGATEVNAGTLVGKNGAFADSSGVAVSDAATLVLNGASALGTNAALVLETAATLTLDFEGEQQVGSLSLDGGSTWLDDGAYGADQLAALNPAGSYSGAGLVRVGEKPAVIGEVSLELLPGNTSLALVWESVSGWYYCVETTTNLVSSPWVRVQTNILGTGGFLSHTGSALQAKAFYRIVLE